jgi:hypothetical protein
MVEMQNWENFPGSQCLFLGLYFYFAIIAENLDDSQITSKKALIFHSTIDQLKDSKLTKRQKSFE